jgi:hypothetical protein
LSEQVYKQKELEELEEKLKLDRAAFSDYKEKKKMEMKDRLYEIMNKNQDKLRD